MANLKSFFYEKFYVEIIVASILFIYAMSTDNMITVIIGLLYFIIFFEIVRVISDFLQRKRIKIRILIDTIIILTLREFIINVVKINNEKFSGISEIFANSVNSHIIIFSGVLVFLFFLRWLSVVTSPDVKG